VEPAATAAVEELSELRAGPLPLCAAGSFKLPGAARFLQKLSVAGSSAAGMSVFVPLAAVPGDEG
jgi:hypothetical protein